MTTATSAPDSPVVLITGATGGLGRVAAAALAADGHRLGLLGTNAARLANLAADLGLAEDAWTSAVADLRVADEAATAVATVEARFGRIDALIHLVGGWTGGRAVADLDPLTLAGMLDQHVWSTFHVARAVVPGMTARGWGRIVAVTSSMTADPGPRSAAYLTAKSAQETLLRVLAREIAADGVTVNLLAVRAIDLQHAREHDPSTKNAAWTTPEEIVATIRYLLGDPAAAVTGQRIALDGRR